MSYLLTEAQKKKLKKQLGLTGTALACGLPDELTKALGIRAANTVRRELWRAWMPKLARANSLLLWVGPRSDDDQAFFEALARMLPARTTLWTFHAMSVLLSDRLTGDAVQTLLVSHGLVDKRACNAGAGFYARSFVRMKGSRAQKAPVPEPPEPESPAQSSADVARRDTIRIQKVREALTQSRERATAESMRTALKGTSRMPGTTKTAQRSSPAGMRKKKRAMKQSIGKPGSARKRKRC